MAARSTVSSAQGAHKAQPTVVAAAQEQYAQAGPPNGLQCIAPISGELCCAANAGSSHRAATETYSLVEYCRVPQGAGSQDMSASFRN